ncbi:MAG: hypothetical protein GY708_03790, partial [Actinomycetia bacterium]|nr:hypothetical protein [Actinomycetes bacterium]
TGTTYVDVVDGETTTADAQLNSGAVIAGTVTDADTGEPLASGLPNLVGVDLVIIASSVKPRAVRNSLADVEVPLLTWEAYLFDDLGLSTRRRETTVDYRSMDLASGESVTVYAQQHRLAWGSPSADAAIHATVPGQPDQATWFTYLPGDALANGKAAPSCRTALFSDYRGTLDLTAHGEAIFVDAVGYSSRLRARFHGHTQRARPRLDCPTTPVGLHLLPLGTSTRTEEYNDQRRRPAPASRRTRQSDRPPIQ